jgi:hypothetical protein
MPNDCVNIEKHIKTYLLNTSVITENAKLKKKVRKNWQNDSVNIEKHIKFIC